MFSPARTAIAALLSLTPALAQPTSSQIDAELNQCLQQSGGVTVTMRNCHFEASVKLDALLNEVYKALMGRLPRKKGELLRESQRKWLAFRNADQKLAEALNPEAGGTLGLTLMDSYSYAFLLRRVQALEAHLESCN